jgi:hypothetical protein
MCLSGASIPDAGKNVPDAPLSVVDAPLSVPDVPPSVPDAPPSVPDARRPDAPRPQPDACSPLELLGNGDFDSSSGPPVNRIITPWQASQVNPPLVLRETEFPIDEVTADTSPFSAVLGGVNNKVDILVQRIVVPAGVQELRLTGKTWIVTDENPNEPMERDVMNIEILDENGFPLEQLAHFSNKSASNGWNPFSMTAQMSHAGTTILFRIRASNAMMKPTTFFVDTLSLISPCN